MKTFLLIALLASSSIANGPKHVFKDPLLDDEMNNVYHDIGNALKGTVRVSSATITNLTVTNLTVTSLAGTIKQIVEGGVATTFSTTAATFQTTNATVTITPLSASSKILVFAQGNCQSAGAAAAAAVSIFRGATNIGDATSGFAECAPINGNVSHVAMFKVDSPATTSATTYTAKLRSGVAGQTVYFPPPTNTTVSPDLGSSNVIAIEVGQ